MAEVKDYSAEALLAKEKEVELDTDDVKEESVQLEEKPKQKEEPNLNLGEVDLGYTGSTDIIINGADVGDAEGYNQYPSSGSSQGTEAISTLGSIDVGGKQLLLTVAGAGAATGGTGNEGTIDVTIVGNILIATNE